MVIALVSTLALAVLAGWPARHRLLPALLLLLAAVVVVLLLLLILLLKRMLRADWRFCKRSVFTWPLLARRQ